MLFVFSVEVSFSLHSLEEIALDFKYCCPSPSLPARQHYSPEDVRNRVNLVGEESEENGSSEAETVYVAVVLLPAAGGLTNFFAWISSVFVYLIRCQSGERRKVV